MSAALLAADGGGQYAALSVQEEAEHDGESITRYDGDAAGGKQHADEEGQAGLRRGQCVTIALTLLFLASLAYVVLARPDISSQGLQLLHATVAAFDADTRADGTLLTALPAVPADVVSSVHTLLPQGVLGVCILFNWMPSSPALHTLFRHQLALHRHVLVLGPFEFAELPGDGQLLFANQTNVAYAAVKDVNGGMHQQYSLERCLQHWHDRRNASMHAVEAAAAAGEAGSVYDASVLSLHGVMYMSDDQYFDWREVLLPRCVHDDAKHSPLHASFTSTDPATMRFRYPLDELWYQQPLLTYDMTSEATRLGDWNWLNHFEGFPAFRATYWAMPPDWRAELARISGVPNGVATFAVADMVYVPFHHNISSVLLDLLHTLNTVVTPAAGRPAISETLFAPLMQLALVKAGREPLFPLSQSPPAFVDPTYYPSLYHRDPSRKDVTYIYRELTTTLQRMQQAALASNSSRADWQLRPVPIRWDGYYWERPDEAWLEWVMHTDGDPVMMHPLKLSDRHSLHTRLFVDAQQRILHDLLAWQHRPDQLQQCREVQPFHA